MNPAHHAGNTYLLHGPVEMNHVEIAAEMSGALGREITYRSIDLKGFKKRLDSDDKFSDTFSQLNGGRRRLSKRCVRGPKYSR